VVEEKKKKAQKFTSRRIFLFLVPDYSEIAVQSPLFAEGIQSGQKKKSKGIMPLQARDRCGSPYTGLHYRWRCREACRANFPGVSAIVVFTSSDPHHLPQEMNPRIVNAGFHRMDYGVCFRPDQQHGYRELLGWFAAFAN